MAIDATQENLERKGMGGGSGAHEWGADYQEGTQDAVVLWVDDEFQMGNGQARIKLTLGLDPCHGREMGAKCDLLVRPYGPALARLIDAVCPDLRGRSFEGRELVGRRLRCDVGTWESNNGPRPQVIDDKGDDGCWVPRIAPVSVVVPYGAPAQSVPAQATVPAPATSGSFDW